ncbi:MAG: rhodanese-like domain-containing protein [Burkholderiales bacterium]|nr:rhodanese-like domain-containing protein [Burkholderiales bacterium]
MADVEMCDELLEKASDFARENDLPYAGALTPKDTWTLLQNDATAMLVDVRTQAELDWVGFVDLYDDRWIHIEWNVYPQNTRNPEFLSLLEEAVPKDCTVVFLCRSGIRSHHAAKLAAEAGYKTALNILEGFEGEKNTQGHRNKTGGWRKANLPWLQN